MDILGVGVNDVRKRRGGFLKRVTPIILTYNEEPNIIRVLDKLSWASEVVVVDSGSDDGTLEILNDYSNVRCIYRKFDNHANQWNFALNDTEIKTDWVLALDADYVLTDQLINEIDLISHMSEVGGYQTRFRYCVWGKALRGTLYPPVTTLFRLDGAIYEQDGHTQRVVISGAKSQLQGVIHHDDRKPLSRWLWAQDRYAKLEANLLMTKPKQELRLQDRLRRMIVVTPWLVPLYCMTVGRGALDGWAGIYYALQRGVAEAALSLRLIERRLEHRKS